MKHEKFQRLKNTFSTQITFLPLEFFCSLSLGDVSLSSELLPVHDEL